MKKYLTGASAAALVVFGLVETSGAADLPVEIPVVEPVVAPLWSGFYVGGQIGYDFNADISRNPRFNDIDRRGRRIVDDVDECFEDDGEFAQKVESSLEGRNLTKPLGVGLGDTDAVDFYRDIFDGSVPLNIFTLEQKIVERGGDFECFVAFIGDRNDRGALGPYSVSGDDDDHGWEAGFYVGGDVQYGSLVFGALADINWIDLESGIVAVDSDGTTAFVANVDMNWYATLRARAGFAFDRFLVYGHGGLAFAHLDVDGTGRDVTLISEEVFCDRFGCVSEEDIALVPASFSDDEHLWGYAIGLGGEALVTDNVSAKVEYQYTNLGEETFGGLFDETEAAEVEIDFHTVRLGVAFRF